MGNAVTPFASTFLSLESGSFIRVILHDDKNADNYETLVKNLTLLNAYFKLHMFQNTEYLLDAKAMVLFVITNGLLWEYGYFAQQYENEVSSIAHSAR